MKRLAEIGRTFGRQAFLTALALAFAVGACGGGDPPSGPDPDPDPVPQIGLIQVTTTTAGAELDADGYSTAMDGNAGRSIGLNGVITFADVVAGQHQVVLTGLAANCTVTGANSRTVTVTAGTTAQVAFAVTCVATSGSIAIVTVTTGSFLDSDGYTVAVLGAQSQGIGINGAVTIDAVPAGARSVELSGVAGNCSVGGTNPTTTTVSAGATAHVQFGVACIPPAPGTIAFLSTRGGSSQAEIFVMDAAGSVVTQVTQMAAQKWEPLARLSPDGTKILFAAGDLGHRDLWVVNTDGTGLRNLTNSVEDETQFGAEWSPDGTQVVYHYQQSPGMWAIGASGGVPTELTSLRIISSPDWSPDGSRIAFTAFTNPQAIAGAVYVMSSDGSGLQQLTSAEGGISSEARWSPDGSKIAFSHWTGSGYLNIYIMNPDGSGITQLTNIGWDAERMRWSPDGAKIAFTSKGLWVMNPDGSGQQKLTDLPLWWGPEWSPDGSTIAFTAGTSPDTKVYTIRPDGSGLSNITNTLMSGSFLGSWGP